MIDITYVPGGNATNPQGDGNKLIFHINNNINAWGAGFVLALSKKWPQTKSQYHKWYKDNGCLTLGTIQAVQVEKDIAVINMIGQNGCGFDKDGNPPVRYDAIRECLQKVAKLSTEYKATVHAPYYVGAGLAGGDWDTIEGIIKDELSAKDISVTLYDFENRRG